MKVLVVLSAVLASCLATPSIGYGYSAISPLTDYSSLLAPYSYAYSAPILDETLLPVPYAHPIAPIAPVAPVAAPVKTQYHSQNELGQAEYGHSEPLQAHHAVQDAYGNKIGSFSYVDTHGAVHETHYVADAEGYRVSSNDLPLAPAAAAPLPLLHRKRRQAWNGPQASPVVTPTGHLAETPEVAAARAAHLGEHARQNTGAQPQAQSWNQQPQASWNQAPASPTPSWNQAPAARWNQPQAAAPSWNQQPATQSWNQQPATQSWNQPQAAARSWSQPANNWNQAPAASVSVTPSGNLADTPEVSAARAAFFADFARSASAAEPTASDDGSYKPDPSWDQPEAPAQSWNQASAPAATPYSSWNQQPAQSWNQQPAAQSWNQQPAAQTWNQPQAAAYSSWQQPQAATWAQQPSWNQSPSGGIPDTPEVAAAKAAHLAEHAAAASRRSKRSVIYQTPASTSPLAAPLIAPLAPAPIPYAAPAISYAAPAIPYAAPAISYAAPAIPYAAPAALPLHGGIPALRTDIVHNPGHSVSYRIDSLHPTPLLLK